MKIQLLEPMEASVLDGRKIIPAGTIMEKTGTQLSWTYFRNKDLGLTMIIMGYSSLDWSKVKIL